MGSVTDRASIRPETIWLLNLGKVPCNPYTTDASVSWPDAMPRAVTGIIGLLEPPAVQADIPIAGRDSVAANEPPVGFEPTASSLPWMRST